MRSTNLRLAVKDEPVVLKGRQLVSSVCADLSLGLAQLDFLCAKTVTIFGSARPRAGTPHYDAAEKLAAELARRGYAIITGGGPGIMEAGNKGASREGGLSIGVNLRLPFENGNDFQNISLMHSTFASRKLVFLAVSDTFIVMPGGFGTLDEFTEVLTNIQTGLMQRVPVLLFDRAFWSPFVDFLKKSLLSHGYIKQTDLELFCMVDSVEEAVTQVEKFDLSFQSQA